MTSWQYWLVVVLIAGNLSAEVKQAVDGQAGKRLAILRYEVEKRREAERERKIESSREEKEILKEYGIQ